ncbi:aminoglycoside 6-adenylyltransferase [Vagococcus fessus]|uniref:Aminoglycoside adenylyltransferase n=1 Tax=Vagococcus fessus TaxID=120370 RepID=A0A430A7B3_9ENTE|nr:aminoglycoside 6-adenylyltransferase [Vagococcus fessus]RSU03006.1 aminoglycoside adenylyltransferase [Vagococcus fessus]
MRTDKEMLEQIMTFAQNDERVRAVTLDGSRVNPSATRDKYSDFDCVFYVKDIQSFTKKDDWLDVFGERLIMQKPMDWFSEPYDFEGIEKFAYLIQFEDGHRLDLTLCDVRKLSEECNKEPRQILLNKDNFSELVPVETEAHFYIKKPTEKEFLDTVNEFRWLCLSVTKGICRKELMYAKHNYDQFVVPMVIEMVNWKIGLAHEFKVSTGAFGKYIGRYLSEDEMTRFQGIFPNGDFKDISNKLMLMFDYFGELEDSVAEQLNFRVDEAERQNVRDFMQERLSEQ